jgi:lipid-A-disaccharide synthase-like uncharacterized protein
VDRFGADEGERGAALAWYLSLAGGAVLLGYAIFRRDPVFVLGQAGGLLIYSRNLWFTFRPGRRQAAG